MNIELINKEEDNDQWRHATDNKLRYAVTIEIM